MTAAKLEFALFVLAVFTILATFLVLLHTDRKKEERENAEFWRRYAIDELKQMRDEAA